jgi:hypothetical protein
VVDTKFLCIIRNIELFSTALVRTMRHYLLLEVIGGQGDVVGDNEGRGKNVLDKPGLSGPGSSHPSTIHASSSYPLYIRYRPKRYKKMVSGIMIFPVQMFPKPRMPLPRGPHAQVSARPPTTSGSWCLESPLLCLQRPERRRVSRRPVSCVLCYQ